jgi:hypothetical protein
MASGFDPSWSFTSLTTPSDTGRSFNGSRPDPTRFGRPMIVKGEGLNLTQGRHL